MSSATRLRPFRTTAFKLAAGYLVVFGLFAGGLIGYLVFETSSVLIRDVDQRLTADARRLGQHYQRAASMVCLPRCRTAPSAPATGSTRC
jgi:hypothetical protein